MVATRQAGRENVYKKVVSRVCKPPKISLNLTFLQIYLVQITKFIATFISFGLRPYSVVENVGFQMIVFTLEPRCKILSRRYFTNTATQTLYRGTTPDDALMKVSR